MQYPIDTRDLDAWYGSMAGWNGYDHRLGRCYSGGIHDPQREWEREEGLRESLRSFYCGEVERVKAMHTWRAVRDGKAGLVHAAAASNLTVRFVKVPPRARKRLIKQASGVDG